MFGGNSQFSFGSIPSTSPFGATSTTATSAPANTGFLFGSSAAPAAGTSTSNTLNSTFTFGTSTPNQAAVTPVATQPLTFASGLQNSSTIRPFGSTTAFGSTPASTTSANGSTGFGGQSIFGASAPSTQTTSIFGSPASTFGSTQPTQTASMFGSTLSGTTQVGTTVKFESVVGQDTMRTKNNTFQTINTKLQCICAMKEYLNKSMDELRMDDYQSNRKFPTANSRFGGSTFSTGSTYNTSPFGPTATFSAAPSSTTTSSIFGGATTTASPFSAPTSSTSPFSFNAVQTQASSIFGANTATTTTPFGAATSTAPATNSIFGVTQPSTSIFGSTATTNPFGPKLAVTQSPFGFGTTTSTSTPFSFGSQPATSTSIFSQPVASTPFGATGTTTTPSIFGAATSTAPATSAFLNPFGAQPAANNLFGATTNTSGFAGFGSTAPTSTTTSIFGTPASTTTTASTFGGFGTQPNTSTVSPFSFNTTSTAPSLFGSTLTNATAPTLFSSQPFSGFGLTQTQPAATMANQSFNFSTPFGGATTNTNTFGAPMNFIQPQVQQQNVQAMISITQQRFLAASLLDPFASRGKKTFSEIDQIKPPTDLIVMPTSSTTTTSATTSTSAPITLPLQSNAKKHSHGRPLVDIRFRLQPVSSSPTTTMVNDDVKSPIQTPISSGVPIKSPLMADFSEEEEMVLIGKNKLSKLRLSNDVIDSTFQLDATRSLYPMRLLAELEAAANINNNTNIISTVHTIPSSASTTTIDTASAYVSSTTVNNEQTLHPSDGNRSMLPLHHSTPIIVHKQPSPPISHQSTTIIQSPASSPPPPSTPPPPSSSTIPHSRMKNPPGQDHKKVSDLTKSTSDPRAYRVPTLTRPYYYMKPSVSELKSLFDDDGRCIIKQLTVGHEKYGSVTFYGHINVAGLDLDQIILIERHEVTVYPDDDTKPPVGHGLNIPARITLLGVYPTDRTTREEMTDVARIKAMNYAAYLREVTTKFEGDFIDYIPKDGSWTFMVQHFTRYGLDGSDDEFVVAKTAPPSKSTATIAKPINPNFLDQTIALNDTYALSSPKSQPMDMEEKENSRTMVGSQSNGRGRNQSLIGLSPHVVEQLAQSMFDDDDDDDDFNHFQRADDRMITSTKIITSDQRPVSICREALIEKSTTETTVSNQQLTFSAPKKPERKHVYSTLPKNLVNIRGKYFRTNISSDLRFVSIDTFNDSRLLIQNPMHFSDKIVNDLENFFNIYYSSFVQLNDVNGDVPHIQVRQNEDVVQQFIDFYSKIIDEKNIDENNSLQTLTAYSLQVLELCRLLWAPIPKVNNVKILNQSYYEEQKRRQMLSNWLEQCILTQPKSQQWIMENCELLSRGLFNDCVKFAQDEGELRLAALIHAASGSNHVRDILRHCAHEDIVQLYSKDFRRTIAILSGEFIVKETNLVDENRTRFWQMAFALHLWFANSSSDSIATIVRDFETGFRDQFWLEPIAHYGNTKDFDLRWKLLKFYTDETYPMDYIFDVYGYTSNPFDFRLSWMLYITLQSLGAFPLSSDNDAFLHVNYAQQLENLGLWTFSIFVLLHINDSTNRKKSIDECLHRHVTSEKNLSQDEQILVEKFHLPSNRIFLAKAQRAEYENKWDDAVFLWINARQWRRAHEIYCLNVFHQTLLKGNYQFSKDVLDALDHQRANISHWNRRGGFARQFVEFLFIVEQIHNGQINLTHRVQTNLVVHVHRLCEQLNDVLTEKYFKTISLVDICRRLLSVLNYNRICSNFNNENDECLIKRTNLFHQTILSSVPCSLPVDVLFEQIKIQLRLHRH